MAVVEDVAALARIDPVRVPNNDLLALLFAQSRQANHEAARLDVSVHTVRLESRRTGRPAGATDRDNGDR